jgi:RNA polymerase sigma factor (sigma-70 family)
VVQEAFVKAFRHLAQFKQGHSFRPWLLSIVSNETKNLHRSRERHVVIRQRMIQMLPQNEHSRDDDPCLCALHSERERELWNALDALSHKDRLVLICRYLLELSENETAQTLGWMRGSVKSRTSRALRRLRAALGAGLREEVNSGEQV